MADKLNDHLSTRYAEAEEAARGFRGPRGFRIVVPSEDCICALCEKSIRAEPRKPMADRARVVTWNRPGWPVGDATRHAHPACLKELREKSPTIAALMVAAGQFGLSFSERDLAQSPEAIRQMEEVRALRGIGYDLREAWSRVIKKAQNDRVARVRAAIAEEDLELQRLADQRAAELREQTERLPRIGDVVRLTKNTTGAKFRVVGRQDAGGTPALILQNLDDLTFCVEWVAECEVLRDSTFIPCRGAK